MKDQSKLDDDLKKALSSLNVEDRLPEDFEDRFLTEFKRRLLLESQVRPDTLKRYFDSHFTGFLNPLRVSIFGTAASVALIVMLFNLNHYDRKNDPVPDTQPGSTVSGNGQQTTNGDKQSGDAADAWEKTLREVDEMINSILYFDPDRASMPQEP